MANEKKTYYKYCIVPCCKSTSVQCKDKLFFSVPKDDGIRRKWIKAIKRDEKLNPKLSNKSSLWCCEDHFSLKDDMENYLQWSLTKDVKRLKLKPGTLPHLFHCQAKSAEMPVERPAAKKRRHMSLVQEAITSVSTTAVASTSAEDAGEEENFQEDNSSFQTSNKSTQANILKHFRSKGTNTAVEVTSVATSPMKSAKAPPYLLSQNLLVPQKENYDTDEGSSDFECPSESAESYSSEDEAISSEQFKQHMLRGTILAIEKHPKLLLGLPARSFFVIKLLHQHSSVPINHIYVILKKIRLNLPFSILAIDFGCSISTISRIFSKSVPQLARFLQELILWPKKEEIRARLPIPFRARYAKLNSIIDCLEIQIEKPSNPVHQALTWSSYYNCNTLKYLISCTPDGLVSFISEGYGGRASDIIVTQESGFLDKLEHGTLVMAGRGFKNISHLLEQRGCTLVRPPSVSAAQISTKAEVRQSKQIAALRIHVERVIGRLRDFKMLTPHACMDANLIPVLDKAIIIGCGIINMQDNLMKNQI